MRKEIPALALMLLVLAASGCTSIFDECRDVSCEDTCSGDTRLYNGVCQTGKCRYFYEQCEHGCFQGACNSQPPHLVLEDNPQQKGDFSMEILRAEVETGELDRDEKDRYDFYLLISNAGDSGIFSIKGASIVAETGLMHSSVGFGWSDFMASGENRNIKFTIGDVPPGLREQNTTLVIRTNQGNYYYQASFEP